MAPKWYAGVQLRRGSGAGRTKDSPPVTGSRSRSGVMELRLRRSVVREEGA
jgi:hypothetical protein